MGKERKEDTFNFDFTQTFDMNTHPCIVLGDTLMRDVLDRWTSNLKVELAKFFFLISFLISGIEPY